MQTTSNTTTVLCLFHTHEQAQETLGELQRSQIPPESISVVGGTTGAADVSTAFQGMNLPSKDSQLLSDGIRSGGRVIVVTGPESVTDTAEDIFARHRARKVDEKIVSDTAAATTGAPVKAAAINEDAAIPVIEEELVVGKRQVQRGGVRVYSRMVEVPVQESVVLQEEHAVIERHPTNRAVTEADMEALKIQSIEVTESEEVAVVQKSARVVEEIEVSKEATERTEHISDTVRKTEVEVEQIRPETTTTSAKQRVK